ncbi:(2Fe-2S)-binding protein [Streptomyces collinus]|nr:(2Fe-2S)-binding protein [Streptomyces collinus]UJA13879.1 (2Fe-2S)-binding protein [Streptomyces collinus]
MTVLGPADPLPRGDGWLTTAGLAPGGCGLDAFLARDEAQALRDYGRPARPDVVASFGLHRYAWPASLLITVPWFPHRRVPRLSVTHVSYDRGAGRMAVPPASFACLPGDPAAAPPGAVVVDDEGGAAGRGARGRRRAPGAGARRLRGPPARAAAPVRPEDTRATCPRTCDIDRVAKSTAHAAI